MKKHIGAYTARDAHELTKLLAIEPADSLEKKF